MTKPKQDALAQVNLEQQGFKVYRPLITQTKLQRGKLVNTVESLFPRYLFIQLSTQGQDWSPIRSTKGVLQMVRFGNNFAKVDQTLINNLQHTEQQLAVQTTGQTLFKTGQALRVTSGPFSGLEGEFQSMDADQRVVALMQIMGQIQRLTLDPSAVESKR